MKASTWEVRPSRRESCPATQLLSKLQGSINLSQVNILANSVQRYVMLVTNLLSIGDMKCIILADRRDPRLTADQGRACAALLPVGDKPLVLHTLDALAAAGIRRATIVVRERDLDAVRVALSTEKPPVELEYYAHASNDDGPDAVVERLEPALGEELLIARGDILRSACIADFLARAAAFPGAYSLSATIGAVPAGLRLVRPGASHPIGLARDPEADWTEGPPRIELAGASLSLLTSPAEYHRALLDALHDRYAGLKLGGRRAAAGVTVGRGARVHLDSVGATPAYIGRGAQVARSAELLGDVIIGAGARVEAGASLRATVVLPGSVVPAGTTLEHALVCGTEALMLDSGMVVSLSAAPQPARSVKLTAERVLAWVAVLLALPLWPLAWLAQRLADHTQSATQSPDTLQSLVGLVHVRELHPALLRPVPVAATRAHPRLR
jgi:hypothetical protein